MHEYRGKKNEYLSMDLDFLVDIKVRVTMSDYLKKIVYDFPDTIQGKAPTPAAEKLFTVRDYIDKNILDKKKQRNSPIRLPNLSLPLPGPGRIYRQLLNS